MFRTQTLLLALSLVLIGTLAAPRASASGPATSARRGDEALDLKLAEFRRQVADGSLADRQLALTDLIGTGAPEAMTAVADELRDVVTVMDRTLAEIDQLRFDAEHRRRLVGDLERRVEQDRDLNKSLEDQTQRLEELEKKLSRRRQKQAANQPWLEVLRAELTAFAPTLGSGALTKIEKELWKSVEEAAKLEARVASIEVLACIGGSGTAVRLQKFIVAYVKERVGLERKLTKQMKDVRKLEQRMQEEAERNAGRSSSMGQYERVSAEARVLQERIGELGRLCHAVLDAGGRSLGRETVEDRQKSVQSLLRAQKKGKDGVRRFTLRMLGGSGLADVRAALLALLVAEKDPLVCANLIDALADPAAGEANADLEDYLLGAGLLHESWLVKGRSARALALLRTRAALPVLIERLAAEEGRPRDEVQAALRLLTGLEFHGNAVLWQRWWKENGEGFLLPPLEEARKQLAAREDDRRGGTGFFGIETDSNRILFVVDLSGSMDFSMIPRNNPDDDISGGRQPDLPREGERSRLEEAKIALKAALGGMKRGGSFNIIFYASDVWSWETKLTPTTDESIADALAAVDRLEAVGGTNIYGALSQALDMAGVESSDSWEEPGVDTIYFLSDGRASVGLTTDPDKILEYVRERNASAGIAIHAIGLSGAQDAYLLRRLAEENGGIYVAR